MNWTWLGVAVALFLAFSCYIGYRRGFIKEAVSALCLILSITAVWFINPYVNQFIRENTPIYESVEAYCHGFVEKKTEDVGVMAARQQKEFIDSLGLPDFLTQGMEENNTSEGYRYLAVDNFIDYTAEYLTEMVTNGVSFMISFLLSTLLIRMLTWALNLIARLPVLKGINRLAGALTGAAKAVVFIWIAFLLLTILCNTKAGEAGLELIEQDYMLSFLYEKNIFMKIFMSIFYGK